MKKTIALFSIVCLTGCASFYTKQTDISSTDPYGKPTREITTTAKARTTFSANSKLATWKAAQTDKSQGATVGGLEQASSGTNVVNVLQAIAEILKNLPK